MAVLTEPLSNSPSTSTRAPSLSLSLGDAVELVPLAILGNEHPGPSAQVLKGEAPCEFHAFSRLANNARASSAQASALATSQGMASTWKGSQVSPGARVQAA